MADLTGSGDVNQPILHLNADEKRAFQYLFEQADTEKLGVITGEVAVKFFERTKLAPAVLGEIWQIADTENRGLLTMAGFCQVLRLIGHYQAGRDPSPELAFRPAPLPKFEGLSIPSAPAASQPFSPAPASAIQPQMSGGPIRVPPLAPAKASEYAGLFEKSGAVNGVLSGENAKQIFEKARLPNEILGRIWNLADTEQRGALNITEFIIAMHLLASYRTGVMKALPNTLPAGLYEAATRRSQLPTPGRQDPVAPIPRQFSGTQRTQSPLGRPPYGTPPQSAQATGGDWLISQQEKTSYDNLFSRVDTTGRGFITGEQAVQFFSDSGLPEDVLAGIWDLADINSEGQLSRDEFAVAMYLIRQQRKPGGSQLPSALPPNLVPPSMRNQVRPSTASGVTAAPEPPPPVPLPKSAADDLFGLDAFAAPAPAQVQQSTGGSNSFGKPFDNDPFASKTASPTSPHPFQPSPRNPASTFKPFMPTSSFGQTLTSHSTGQSGTSATQPRPNPPSAMDDLLGGESDPEINKKLTQDSTELANMSNQMTTLRTQMQEVQNKKVTTENDLNSITTQKRDLELRLSQFKTQYEQEVKAVKALEDRLATSRNETRKLQQELAMIEGTYQDLQGQHRQVGSDLEADQRENNSLKERIRQMNAEIAQLRPQLDKMRSDARQQKGLVAINKKQLATNEGERDKIKNEMNDLNKAVEEESRSPQQAPVVASPATSTASHNTNPFFRKSPQPTENTMSPSGFSREPHKDFDSVFGTFMSPQTSAPPTSFRSESQNQVPTFSAPSGQSVRSSEGPDVPTPSTSPPLSSYQESPRAGEPPAPPESRQFASSFLPLREAVPRSDSFSSSVKVSAPASRYGGPSGPGNETPTVSKASPASTPVPEKPAIERTDTTRTETDNFNPSLFERTLSTSPVASIRSDAQRSGSKSEDRKDTFSSLGAPLANQDIPGAFPRDTTSPLQQMQTGESSLSTQSKGNNRTDPFAPSASTEQPRPGGKVDFDAAFAGFGSVRQNTGSSSAANGTKEAPSKFNQEFPPIQDIGHDDDSDSTSEQGFADNFTSASPQQHRSSVEQSQQRPSTANTGGETSTDEYFKVPPPTTRLDSNTSGLPSPGAQKSPPSYDSTVGPTRSGSNQFPPEFGGLLPARTDPTSPTSAQSPEKSFSTPAGSQGAALFGGSSSKPSTTSPPPADTPSSTVPSDAYHSAVSYGTADTNKGPSPPSNISQPGKSAFNDDFDAGFDDLTDAKEADDKTDDDFMFSSQQRDGLDEFNPVFDSPAASKSNTMASQQTPTGKPLGEDSFSDFEHLSQTFGQPKAPQPAASSHDWDAIFSNLESSQADKSSQQASGELGKSVFDTLDREEAAASSSKSPMPQLGRAISTGTEHDDPILKKLTGMGYARGEALSALEKFDYDINKAVDFLTSGQ